MTPHRSMDCDDAGCTEHEPAVDTEAAALGECVICHESTRRRLMCDACSRSYDRYAHDDASVLRAMEWAADRAARIRGASRRRGGTVAISFTPDEIVMLHDRVSAGAEVSEEPGWDDLLDKIEAAGRRVAAHGKAVQR